MHCKLVNVSHRPLCGRDRSATCRRRRARGSGASSRDLYSDTRGDPIPLGVDAN